MTKRRDRRVGTPLPRPTPSEKFLASGPTRNATARRRIASAGKAVARSGKWPTLERVIAQDPRIKPATLDRNADALDDARRLWLDARAAKLVDAGTFPTVDLLQAAAGRVRLTYLIRFEDALAGQRRRWVGMHGPHPDWSDAPVVAPDPAPDLPREDAPIPALESVTADSDPLELAQRQLKRLMAERASDRKKVVSLKSELADVKEALRRALAMNRKLNAVELSKPSASTRS